MSFLTLLPVGVANPTEPEISRSRGWYPFVGLLYGVMLVGVVQLLALVSPVFGYTILGMALLVILPALVNRFLHLDGLMDFCDAMWGGRTAERRMEIMRDSRVGSFAVAGAFCVLLVKFAALSTLTLSGWLIAALLVFPVISRWSMTLLLTAFPYGRQQGIGSAFFAGNRPWLATVFALCIAIAISWLILGIVGLSVLVASSLLALALGFWATRRLGGGLTGDCYGAANKIVEAFSLTLFTAWIGYGMSKFIETGYGGGMFLRDLIGPLPWTP